MASCHGGRCVYIGDYEIERLDNPPEVCISVANRIAKDLECTLTIRRIGPDVAQAYLTPISSSSIVYIYISTGALKNITMTIHQNDPNEGPDTIRARQTIDKILNEVIPGHWTFTVYHGSMAW
jgi:hypothetical protein